MHRTTGGIGHVHHLQAVLEGAGGLGCQLLEEFVVRVRQFQELVRGNQVEDAFKQVDDRIQGHCQEGADKQEQDIDPDQAVPGVDQPEAEENRNRKNSSTPFPEKMRSGSKDTI